MALEVREGPVQGVLLAALQDLPAKAWQLPVNDLKTEANRLKGHMTAES